MQDTRNSYLEAERRSPKSGQLGVWHWAEGRGGGGGRFWKVHVWAGLLAAGALARFQWGGIWRSIISAYQGPRALRSAAEFRLVSCRSV